MGSGPANNPCRNAGASPSCTVSVPLGRSPVLACEARTARPPSAFATLMVPFCMEAMMASTVSIPPGVTVSTPG